MKMEIQAKKESKILFVQKEMIPLGVKCISAYLKLHQYSARTVYFEDPYSNGSFHFFDTAQLFEKFKAYLLETIAVEKPTLIGFSTFTMNYRWALSVAQFLRKSKIKVPIIFGGYHATMVPEEVIMEDAIDMLCVGEGEETMLDLMNALENGRDITRIRNLWVKQDGLVIKNGLYPLIRDLDRLPFPDDTFQASIRNTTYMLMGSRGCPYHCTYCANNYYAGIYEDWHKVRFRSVENILAEVDQVFARHRIKRLEVMDDIVAYDNKRIEELFGGLKKRFNLPYSCFLHPNLINAETISILKETNCYWLKVGVQSTNEANRRTFLQRPETDAQLRKVAEWCHAKKLSFSFDHIFSLPCDTAEDLKQSVRFYNETRPNIINFGSLVYLPKTAIVDQAREKGILSDTDVQKINRGEHITATTSNVMRLQGEGESDAGMRVLIGRVAYLYSLISFRSRKHVDTLLKNGFLEESSPLPQFKIVSAKFMAKYKAGQFHIYWWVICNLILSFFRRKYFTV